MCCLLCGHRGCVRKPGFDWAGRGAGAALIMLQDPPFSFPSIDFTSLILISMFLRAHPQYSTILLHESMPPFIQSCLVSVQI